MAKITARMFTTRGTARVGHASDITVKKIGQPFKGVCVSISYKLHPDYHLLTTLDMEEVKLLASWLNQLLAKAKGE